MSPLPATPIHPRVEEREFLASLDQSRQTYLRAEFGPPVETDGPSPDLVVWLHGALSHQEQGMTKGIYGDFFGRLAAWMSRRRVVYLCPEYRGNSWMGPAAESDLKDVLRAEKARVAPSRTLLLGGSMGGTSALIFAGRNPGEAQGILALCPATDPAAMHASFPDHFQQSYGGPPDRHAQAYRERAAILLADHLAPFPIFLAHGSADAVIPVEHSRRLASALAARGGRFRYEELPGGDHDSPMGIRVGAAMDFLLTPEHDPTPNQASP